MKKYKTTSTIRPPEWDIKSSPTAVYHNFNIVEVPATEYKPFSYEYDVEQYTKQEYIAVLREQIESENLVTMEAVAEIYEMLMGGDL